MSLAPLSVSIEYRERHPYRSLYAEMLFQSFRDALMEASEEASTTVQEIAEGTISEGNEEERTRRDAKQRSMNAQRSMRDGLRQ